MQIRVKLKKYIPDLVVVGLLVAFYLHSQGINDQLYTLLENVRPAESTNADYDIRHNIWQLNQSVNQIWIYFILFITVINFFRKKQKSKEV